MHPSSLFSINRHVPFMITGMKEDRILKQGAVGTLAIKKLTTVLAIAMMHDSPYLCAVSGIGTALQVGYDDSPCQ